MIGTGRQDEITAVIARYQRVSMRSTMKPTTIAEIENRKNEELSRPNCSGESFNYR